MIRKCVDTCKAGTGQWATYMAKTVIGKRVDACKAGTGQQETYMAQLGLAQMIRKFVDAYKS